MSDRSLNKNPESNQWPALKIGISQCLLGEEVRFDGGHKRDPFLTDTFSQFVEWVPVCPEVGAGLGVPREAMRLIGTDAYPKLMAIKTRTDHTPAVLEFSRLKIRELQRDHLDGFIFKKGSPSCGISRVRIYNGDHLSNAKGTGIFAGAFMDHFPLIPVEEEGRLHDPGIRENFIERVFCFHRWRNLSQTRFTHGSLVQFHTRHKLLLLAHSRPHYAKLGQLVASSSSYKPGELADEYGRLFMEGLKVRATVRKQVNVLHHISGYLRKHLKPTERAELREVIADYHQGLIPLIVPLTLIRHYVRVYQVSYLQDQIYLNPHPKELMLRNHV